MVYAYENPLMVLHDTDLHGLSCGVCALHSLQQNNINADVYSHFSLNPQEPATTPVALPMYIERLGNVDLIILDIPVDVRNPKRYIDTLISHARFKGRVLWCDHHGHSQWVNVLNKEGVTAIIVGSSYDLAMLIPRMYNVQDSFIEKWALLGALSDFDVSIKDKVSRDLEQDLCEYLDPVYKLQRTELMNFLGVGEYATVEVTSSYGNVGCLTKAIVDKRIEVDRVLEEARKIGRPLPRVPYSTIGDVVYTTELPQQGLAWKTAWKLCFETECKVAIVPTYNPRINQYAIIIAKYWRFEEVTPIIEEYIQRKFAGRQIVGHTGARSIAMNSLEEVRATIPQVARELNELIETKMYMPKTTRLISDSMVARTLHEDFRTLLQKMTEILEAQQKMYQEYLELKKRQVELLEKLREERVD